MIKTNKQRVADPKQIPFALNKFSHDWKSRVKFSDVDSFGVVHNLQYLYYMEWARTEYMLSLGQKRGNVFIKPETPLLTVHTDVTYLDSLKFDDAFTVKTRVSWIKSSSFEFQSLLLDNNNNVILCLSTILVYYDAKTRKPIPLANKMKELIVKREGDNLELKP